MTLEPRTYGLITQTNNLIRVLIAVIILPGFLMRKHFCGRLSGMFAFEAPDLITSFESLTKRESIKNIYVHNTVSHDLLNKNSVLKAKYNIEKRNFKELYTLKLVKDLLSGESVLLDYFQHLQLVKLQYPFLPLFLSGVEHSIQTMTFPILKHSKIALELYQK